MLFKRIKLENIRSYENIEVNIPKGSVLLSGDIGSGKTTILLALEFALFGLQPGQKGASLLKNGKDEGFIELEFEIDGKNVIIKRTLKRKKTIAQDFASISIDGKTTERAITELKSDILMLLNYPVEFAKKTNMLYRFTVYTPQEEMKQIIFENPEIRLNALRHVFGIEKYKRIRENSTILSSRLREISRIKQAKISDLESSKIDLFNKKNIINNLQKQIPEVDLKLKEILSIKDKKGISKIKDSEIKPLCIKVIKENPKAVEDYKNGEEKSLNFLIGKIMSLSNKRADFKTAKDELLKLLK